jgi:hypothetical protein
MSPSSGSKRDRLLRGLSTIHLIYIILLFSSLISARHPSKPLPINLRPATRGHLLGCHCRRQRLDRALGAVQPLAHDRRKEGAAKLGVGGDTHERDPRGHRACCARGGHLPLLAESNGTIGAVRHLAFADGVHRQAGDDAADGLNGSSVGLGRVKKRENSLRAPFAAFKRWSRWLKGEVHRPCSRSTQDKGWAKATEVPILVRSTENRGRDWTVPAYTASFSEHDFLGGGIRAILNHLPKFLRPLRSPQAARLQEQ